MDRILTITILFHVLHAITNGMVNQIVYFNIGHEILLRCKLNIAFNKVLPRWRFNKSCLISHGISINPNCVNQHMKRYQAFYETQDHTHMYLLKISNTTLDDFTVYCCEEQLNSYNSSTSTYNSCFQVSALQIEKTTIVKSFSKNYTTINDTERQGTYQLTLIPRTDARVPSTVIPRTDASVPSTVNGQNITVRSAGLLQKDIVLYTICISALLIVAAVCYIVVHYLKSRFNVNVHIVENENEPNRHQAHLASGDGDYAEIDETVLETASIVAQNIDMENSSNETNSESSTNGSYLNPYQPMTDLRDVHNYTEVKKLSDIPVRPVVINDTLDNGGSYKHLYFDFREGTDSRQIERTLKSKVLYKSCDFQGVNNRLKTVKDGGNNYIQSKTNSINQLNPHTIEDFGQNAVNKTVSAKDRRCTI